VVKSLELIGSGPVVLVHRQKVRFFQKKNPTSVVESNKATYRHKLTLLRKQKKLLALSFFSFWTQLGHWILSYELLQCARMHVWRRMRRRRVVGRAGNILCRPIFSGLHHDLRRAQPDLVGSSS
jgi:hypothetical protein